MSAKDGTTVAQLEMVLRMTNRRIADDGNVDGDDGDDDDGRPATTGPRAFCNTTKTLIDGI